MIHHRDSNTAISVIMPVHNAGHYLQAAVQSILDQQGVHFELVIIDDHSSDNAIQALPADGRLRVISLQKLGLPAGIISALNAGIDHAQFPLIARMDGDDIAMPNRLRAQLDYYCAHPTIDLVGAVVEIFKDDDVLGGGFNHYQGWLNQQSTPQQIERQMFVECCVAHPTFFMSKSFISSLGGYQATPWPEDYDLLLRAHAIGARAGKPTGLPLLRWRDHSGRLSRNDSRYNRNAFLECKAFYLAQYLKQRHHDTVAIWGAGPTGLKLHDCLLPLGIGVTHFCDINPKLANRSKRGKPIRVAALPVSSEFIRSIDHPLLIAVNSRGAAKKTAEMCIEHGLEPLQDFIQAA